MIDFKPNIDFQPVDFQPTTPDNQQIKEPSLYNKISGAMGRFSTGFAKGELQTLQGLSKLGSSVGNVLLPGQPMKPLFSDTEFLKPEGGYELAGNLTEKVAEFLIPGKTIHKTTESLAKLASQGISHPVLNWLVSTGVKSGFGALTTGFQTSMQREGEIDNAVKINALISAVIPPVASGFSVIGKRMGFTIIKPNQADIRDVKGDPAKATKTFTENIYKHDLGGSLRETAFKSEMKLQKLSRQLKALLKKDPQKFDLTDAYYDTYKKLYNAPKTFGNTQAINSSLGRLANEIDNISGGEGVSLLTANQVKQGAGAKGAWVYGRIDPEAMADEIVYTKFYSKLRDKIDNVGSPIIQKINQTISEIIPIHNAVLRRIPVAERNNLLSLTTDIGMYASVFDPRALALVAADQMSKSGKFANFLVKAADGYFRKVVGAMTKAGISSINPPEK